MLTLYHGRTSVCSIKARLALAEKGVAFESRLMTLRGDQFEPGYMKLNPNAVVPTLVHDGRVVIESTVIMHYVDEAFGGAALMPSDPLARAQARMTEKLMDEHVHVSCMTITFATANRASLAKLAPREMEEELAKAPDPARSEIKRQVVTYGLDAAPVAQALRQQEKPEFGDGAGWLYRRIGLVAGGCRGDPLCLAARQAQAGAHVGPPAWRCRLVRTHSPAAVVQTAVEDWVTPADHERYAKEPDPWPKVRAILRAA